MRVPRVTKEVSHLVTGTQFDSVNESKVWPCSVGECMNVSKSGNCVQWEAAPGTCGCQYCKTTAPMDRHVFTLSRPLRSNRTGSSVGLPSPGSNGASGRDWASRRSMGGAVELKTDDGFLRAGSPWADRPGGLDKASDGALLSDLWCAGPIRAASVPAPRGAA